MPKSDAILIEVPHRNPHYFGPKKTVLFYGKVATDPFQSPSHSPSHFCDEHNKTPIVQSVVAKCDEPLVESDARSVADALDPRGVFRASSQKKDPLAELAMARKILAERSAELADLDAMLAPVRDAEEAIRGSITATHHGGSIRGLNLAHRGGRVPLFARLDALARQWGKTKSERRFVHSEIKGLRRMIENMEARHARGKA